MVGLRKQAATDHQEPIHRSHDELEEVIFTDKRKSYFHGEFVDRLVLFLRGTGCSWVSDHGGCTFCGFWNATNFGEKIAKEDYLHQVSHVLADPGVAVANFRSSAYTTMAACLRIVRSILMWYCKSVA